MPDEQQISDAESDGFSSAVAAFAKEDEPQAQAVAQPNAVPEGDQPPAPDPEPEPELAATEKTEPEKLEEEFVEFSGKQKVRFNSVYGKLQSTLREKAQLEQRLQRLEQAQQPQPAVQKSEPVEQPQRFTEARPKLGQFETTDQWEEALDQWDDRRLKHFEWQLEQRQTVAQQRRQQEEQVAQRNRYETARMNEGRNKYGTEFDNVAADLSTFAPDPQSVMYTTLFGLQHFPEVVMELGKNLVEADRIARLSAHDQIYEIKALEKKLIAKAALATKTQPKLPTKVEAPGQGEDPKPPSHTVSKLRQAAKASGSVQDWQKVFQADPTL